MELCIFIGDVEKLNLRDGNLEKILAPMIDL